MNKKISVGLCLLCFASAAASANVCDSARTTDPLVGFSFRLDIVTVPFSFKAGSMGEAVHANLGRILRTLDNASFSTDESFTREYDRAYCVEIVSDTDSVIANVEIGESASSFDLRADDSGTFFVDRQPAGLVSIDADGRVSGIATVYFLVGPGVVDESSGVQPGFLYKTNRIPPSSSVQVTVFDVATGSTRSSTSKAVISCPTPGGVCANLYYRLGSDPGGS